MLKVEKLTKHRREVSLFCPGRGKTQDLKRIHPELATVEEFSGLSPAELRFAWYYGIYFANAQIQIRLSNSLQFAFYDKLSPEDKKKYLNKNFPAKVVAAINKFQTYDLDLRIQARWIDEKILGDWKKILSIDVDAIDDWDDKKRYIDIQKTIMGAIKRCEAGFGVRETNFLSEEQENLLSEFHKNKK